MKNSRRYSIVAAILDGYGGAPVVVVDRDSLHHHVRPGMIPIVIPGLFVREPIPWENVPRLLARVDAYVDYWIRSRNDPDITEHPAVKLYVLRRLRSYQTDTVNLYDIVET